MFFSPSWSPLAAIIYRFNENLCLDVLDYLLIICVDLGELLLGPVISDFIAFKVLKIKVHLRVSTVIREPLE